MINQATHGLDDDFKTTPDGKFLVWAHDMYEYEREAQAERFECQSVRMK